MSATETANDVEVTSSEPTAEPDQPMQNEDGLMELESVCMNCYKTVCSALFRLLLLEQKQVFYLCTSLLLLLLLFLLLAFDRDKQSSCLRRFPSTAM